MSPIVALDEPDGLRLDMTGAGPAFGSEHTLVEFAAIELGRLGFSSRIAIAPTFACAWAVARFGDEPRAIIESAGVRDAIAPLPVAGLRLESALRDDLASVGIDRVAHLLELPRSTLPARFGEALLHRLDEALGEAMEPIEPVRAVAPPVAEREFDGPTDRVDAIEYTVRDLLRAICETLRSRGDGARSVLVELERSDLDAERLIVTLSQPSQSASRLWKLIQPKLERAHLGFGVEAVRVRVPSAARLRDEQTERWGGDKGPSGAETERAIGELADTLGGRLGTDRVHRVALRESHLPECAFETRSVVSDQHGGVVAATPNDRPTVLLQRPAPAQVVALTPDGPVHGVGYGGAEHEVIGCFGPERIAPEWWRAGRGARDYFAVQLDDGRRLWIFRAVRAGRWFVHGLWA